MLYKESRKKVERRYEHKDHKGFENFLRPFQLILIETVKPSIIKLICSIFLIFDYETLPKKILIQILIFSIKYKQVLH